MTSPTTTVVQVEQSDTGSRFQVLGKWSAQRVEILVSDSVDTWRGVEAFTEDRLSEYLSVLDVSLSEYVDAMKSTLSGRNDFKIQLSRDALTWSKDLGEDVVVEYGRIHLKRINLTETDSTIFALLGSFKDVLEELNATKTQLQLVSDQHLRLKSSFEECIQAKKEMEVELLAKFTAVLNEKKKYIAKIEKKSNVNSMPGSSFH